MTAVKNGSVTPSVTSCLVVGQRLGEPLQETLLEREGDAERDGDRAEGDQEARAKLAEVLDEGRFLAVRQAPREPGHAARRSRARAP